jgi:hypothetical protein
VVDTLVCEPVPLAGVEVGVVDTLVCEPVPLAGAEVGVVDTLVCEPVPFAGAEVGVATVPERELGLLAQAAPALTVNATSTVIAAKSILTFVGNESD